MQHMADEERSAGGDRLNGLEAARCAFYRGDIAATLARHQREQGGWLSMDDLAEYRSAFEPPVVGRFRDLEVYTCGPWCQGPVLAQAFSLLEGIDLNALGHNSPAYIHTVTEVLKLAFADRHRYYGDPRFVRVPMAALLHPAYAARRQKLIRPDRAAEGMPPPGCPEDLDAAFLPASPQDSTAPEALDTSYVCVVDSQGNLFSATPSDGAEGGPVVPGLGFVASTRGSQSWTDPALPACLAPGKRPRLTPSPAIVSRPGSWRMPIGSPGNDVQPQAVLQVLLNNAVFGMSPQEAVDQPRFATFSFPRSSEPHNYSPRRLNLEGRIPAESVDALRQLEHDAVPWPDWEWRAGAVCLVRLDEGSGLLEGAADPRRPCGAVGW
jgi:gamma-glutamyltranspeptidase/glutathione hydrolase